MTDGVVDNLKIHNHAPSTDGTSAVLPAMMAMASKSGTDGGFLGAGGGLLGGLVLGSLLRNGNLFGGDGAASAVSQPTANMSIMATLGDIKQAIAVGGAQMETSNANQTIATMQAINASTGAAQSSIGGLKDVVNANAVALMQMLNGVNTNINNDGEKTRALITSQYEATLNRQLTEANNALIELRTEQRQRASEVNITQTVNQAQAQAQQQQQFGNLQNLLLDAVQSIRATNQAINIGAGTLTANPTNTNTNTRVN